MQVAHVTDLARRSAALGCDLVRVFTSYEHGSASFLAAWRTTVEALRSCCDRAAAHGVRIGVQNHHDIGVDTVRIPGTPGRGRSSQHRSDFDCWSPFLRGEDVVAAAAALACACRSPPSPTTSCCAAGISAGGRELRRVRASGGAGVPMGQGDLPYEGFLHALQANGFDGWVTYECARRFAAAARWPISRPYARAFSTTCGVSCGPPPRPSSKLPRATRVITVVHISSGEGIMGR